MKGIAEYITAAVFAAIFVVGFWSIVLLSAIAFAQPPATLWQPEPTDTYSLGPCLSLWNGEQGVITGQYYALMDTAAHSGGYGFLSVATGYMVPRIKHNTIDLTRFDEVWIWARAATVPCEISITGRSYKGDLQTVKQQLTPEWQLIRLVVANLDAGNASQTALNEWVFKPIPINGILPQFCVDDIWAVKLLAPADPVEPDPTDSGDTDPDPADPPPVTYGDWIPQPIVAELVFKSVGSDGSERVYTRQVTVTLGSPIITVIAPPAVQP